MTIDLYYMPESPPCRAVLMVARHLKVPVKLKWINLMKDEQKSPEFCKINPMHCLPTIVDDGWSLWESRAIIAYLCNAYAPNNQVYPADVGQRATVDKWLMFDIGTLYQTISKYEIPMFEGSIKVNPEHEKKMCDALQLLDDQLSRSKYVAGPKLTVADISLLASVDHLTNVLDYDISDFKFVAGWQARLKRELPYYRDVCEEGIDNLRNYLRSKIDANPAAR